MMQSTANQSTDVIATREKYEVARTAKTGSDITCPVCSTVVKKINYQQVFCSNSGSGNCKDHYWNLIAERNPLKPKHTAHEKMQRHLVGIRPMVVAALNESQDPVRSAQLTALLYLVEETINDPR